MPNSSMPSSIEGQQDLVTPPFSEHPTMAAARERIHAIARELPRSQRFDDETQARPNEGELVARWSPGRRAQMNEMEASQLDVPYESLPSLEAPQHRDQYDSFGGDSAFTNAPSTALRQDLAPHADYNSNNTGYADDRNYNDAHAHDDGRYSDHDQSYDSQYGAPTSYSQQHQDNFSEPPPPATKFKTQAFPPVRDEDSGPRARKDVTASPNYDVASYEANYPKARPAKESEYPANETRAERSGSSRDRGSYKAPRDEVREDSYAAPAREDSYQAPPPAREDSYRGGRKAPEAYLPTQHARREESYRGGNTPAPAPAPSARRDSNRSGEGQGQGSYRRNQDEISARDYNQNTPAPHIPQAPAVPRDMKVPANFVMGVQPIRTPGSVAAVNPAPNGYGLPQPQMHMSPSRTPNMGVGTPYGNTPAPYGAPSTMAASPRAMTPGGHLSMGGMAPHAALMGGAAMQPAMHVRAATNRPNAYTGQLGHQMQMTEVEEAQQGSKVGRFAWFVFGAAFGIFFAFFATGFVPRLGGGKKDEAQFPPPAALPTQPVQVAVQPPPPPVQVAPAPVAPPPVQVQAAPPPVQFQAPAPVFAQAPAAQAPAMKSAPPAFIPPAPPPVVMAPAPQPAPQPAFAQNSAPRPAAAPAAAPAPARGQRAGAIARRSAPAPKDDADEAPAKPLPTPKASAPKKGGDDNITDLLSAGLAP